MFHHTQYQAHQASSDALQRTIRLPDSPCLVCGSQAFTAVMLHQNGDPLSVRFCPQCNARDVRPARTGEIRAALDGLDGISI